MIHKGTTDIASKMFHSKEKGATRGVGGGGWNIHSIQMLFVNTVKHTAYFHNCVQLALQVTNKIESINFWVNSMITLWKDLLREQNDVWEPSF